MAFHRVSETEATLETTILPPPEEWPLWVKVAVVATGIVGGTAGIYALFLAIRKKFR